MGFQTLNNDADQLVTAHYSFVKFLRIILGSKEGGMTGTRT